MKSPILSGKKVLEQEARYIKQLSKKLDNQFYKAITSMLNCKGHIICTGIGKSGHVARKIAASLSSLGTPAVFMHATEGVHGDLGMIKTGDIVLAISNSGETKELLYILGPIKEMGIFVISITGNNESSIARISDVHICTYADQEADSRGLAPTTSSTVTLALGDALALVVADMKNFTKKDFHTLHPSGSLGEKLDKLNL